MKKLICALCCLALLLALLPAALAIEQGEYTWQGHTIKLLEIMDPSRFAPAGMKDNQRAIALQLEVPPTPIGKMQMVQAIFSDARLTDSDGHSYMPGTALLKGDVITHLYAIPKDVRLDTLKLHFSGERKAAAAVNFEDFAGTWEGQSGNIHLTFTVQADGKGSYTFEQAGYKESYEVALSADDHSFSVDIPEDNQLGIKTCEGTWAYENEVLTLDVVTTFKNGRPFTYSIPCKRVAPASDSTDAETALLGAWGGEVDGQEARLIFEKEGRMRLRFSPKGNVKGEEKAGTWRSDGKTLHLQEDGKTGAETWNYALSDGVLTLYDLSGKPFLVLTRVDE